VATVRTDDGVLGYVRALFRGAAVAGLGDAQLLERYRSRGDDEAAGHAFAALVARHGAMVFRACLAVTRDRADAEDAFQATILVLARRARSLWVRDSLGPWLHTVAVRIAADARDAAERRRRHEQRYAEMAATFAPAGAGGGDLRAVLHEEVARLPRKLRAPVVLCDLEGLTHEQAAVQLGCPVGTVKTRLTGARERLRGRLVRRGIAPAVGPIATTLAAEAAEAAVPAALTQATVHAAAAVRLTAGAAAAGVVAATVDSLVKGALRAMMLSRIKFVVMTLLTAAAVLGGAFACRGLLGNATADEKRPDPPAAKTLALEVTVIDKRTGRPVGGATVKATLDEATRNGATDSAGRHVVTVPDTGVTYLAVHVRKEGYVPVVANWQLPRNDGTAALPASYTIPLEPATSISGLVKDPEGRPVAGATVYVLVPRGPATEPGVLAHIDIWDEPCPTDARGRWRCNLVPSDLKAPWLRVVHADFVSTAVTSDDAALLASLRDGSAVISLARGLPVTGRVLDAQDRPVAGAAVGLGESRAGWLFSETTTDAGGRFRFAHTRSGRTVLTVQAKGHAPDLKEFEVVDGLPPLEFRLGPPRTVRGRVVNEAGEPVGGTRVVTDSWRGYRTIDIRTVADAEGRFRVDDLPDEVVEFQFARERHMNLPNQPLTPSKEAVVTLTRPLTIRGTVTDAKTGQPIDRFTLYDANDPASGSNHWDRDRPRPSRGGRYEITATWPYPTVRALRVEAEGYLPATSRGFKAGEGQVTYDFRLTPGSEPKRPAVTGGRPVTRRHARRRRGGRAGREDLRAVCPQRPALLPEAVPDRTDRPRRRLSV
jgi:RNA polymerase sigma factor (sigma-70 family)